MHYDAFGLSRAVSPRISKQFLDSGFQDVFVIKSQGRDFIKRKPPGFCRIVPSGYFRYVCKSVKYYAYDPFSRIAAYIRESVELCHSRANQTCLFQQFAPGAFFSGFVDIHEASGKCPFSFERLPAPFNQKDFYSIPVPTENHTVGAGRRGLLRSRSDGSRAHRRREYIGGSHRSHTEETRTQKDGPRKHRYQST